MHSTGSTLIDHPVPYAETIVVHAVGDKAADIKIAVPDGIWARLTLRMLRTERDCIAWNDNPPTPCAANTKFRQAGMAVQEPPVFANKCKCDRHVTYGNNAVFAPSLNLMSTKGEFRESHGLHDKPFL